jgi:hypothetical protein
MSRFIEQNEQDANGGWISVSVRLPNDGDRVWCSIRLKGDKFIYSDALIYWKDGTHWTRTDCTPLEDCLTVTHWRELPAPPTR